MQSRWTILISSLALAAATLAAAPAPASAEHRALNLEIQSLTVRADDGELVVEYRVGGGDWTWAHRHGADLAFHVRGFDRGHGHGDHHTQWHGAMFDSRSGTLRIPWTAGSQLPRGLQVRLVATAPHSHVRRFHYHGHHHATMRLHRTASGHFRRSTSRTGDDLEDLLPPRVVELCDAHTLGADPKDRCLQTVAFAMPTSETIQALSACGDGTSHTDEFLECAERATEFHADAAPAIRTCSEMTNFSGYFADCLHWAARISHDAARVVRVCEKRAGNLDENIVRCIERASRIESDAASKVAACSHAEDSTGGFEQCLADFEE